MEKNKPAHKEFLEKSLEQRKELARAKVLESPNRVPTVILYKEDAKQRHKKITMPKTLLVNELMVRIIKMLELSKKDQSATLVPNKGRRMLNNNSSLGQIQEQYIDEDGWLYLKLQPSSPF